MLLSKENEFLTQFLEFQIPESLIQELVGFFKFTPDQLRRLSIYQIFMYFEILLKTENKFLTLIEEMKPWINPVLYSQVKKYNRRINDDFDLILERLRSGAES